MYYQLHFCALETARCALNGLSAWVTRHTIDTFQIVNVIGSHTEIESSLRIQLMRSAQKLYTQNIQLVRWNHHTFLCVGLSSKPEIDGCIYMLCVQLNCQLELSERLNDVINGLRSSLQNQIHAWATGDFPAPMQRPIVHSVVCSCCCRLQILDNGRIFWDDFSSQKTGHGASLRICDDCAFSLYRGALQDAFNK